MLTRYSTCWALLSLVWVVPNGNAISLTADPELHHQQVPPGALPANTSVTLEHGDVRATPAPPQLYGKLAYQMFYPWYVGPYHVFPRQEPEHTQEGSAARHFFDFASWQEWSMLGVEVVLLMIFDAVVIRRLPDTPRFHVFAVVLWVAMAALCAVNVLGQRGAARSLDWVTGYILEWVLSFENIFVFHLVLKAFHTPPSAMHAAVFKGILAAIGLRLSFFLLVATLMRVIHWIRWPFGLLLMWSGVTVAMDEDEGDESDFAQGAVYRSLTWCFGSRLSGDFEGSDCLARDGSGRLQITRLVPVIVCIEFTDLVFALDSVTAKVANIPDQYISFSSTVVAMFALRSAFFILKDLTEMFALMKYGLAIILLAVGLQLMFMDRIEVGSFTVAILIVSVLIASIFASSIRPKIIDSVSDDGEGARKHGPT